MRRKATARVRTAHVPNASLSFREGVAALARPLTIAEAERLIESLLEVPAVVLFASARGALSAAVEALGEGDRVAVPAYTCAAVANAVLSAGKCPVYVDVDDRGLVPAGRWPDDALPLIQDTYGFEAAGPEDRLFVRDAAHRAYPLRMDAATVTVTSFEHSKSLSAGRGGLAVTQDPALAAQLRALRDRHGSPPPRLRHTIVTLSTIAMGRLDFAGRRTIGELFRKVAWHLDESRLLGQSTAELAGSGVDPELLGPPDRSAARLVVSQLRRAPAVAAHRAHIVAVYDRAAGLSREPLSLCRYPLAVADPVAFEDALLEVGWDVRGRWFTGPLHPRRSNLAAFDYIEGAAPNGERLSATIVNLPTHPLVHEVDAIQMIEAALDMGADPL